jgi:hypothetical protein
VDEGAGTKFGAGGKAGNGQGRKAKDIHLAFILLWLGLYRPLRLWTGKSPPGAAWAWGVREKGASSGQVRQRAHWGKYGD